MATTRITVELVDEVQPIEQHQNVQNTKMAGETSPIPLKKTSRRLQMKKMIEDSMQDRGVIRLRVENLNGTNSPVVSPFAIKLDLDRKQMRRNFANRRRAVLLYHLARFHHKFGIRHIVLVLLLALYSVLGGVMFMRLESDLEMSQLMENQKVLAGLIDNVTRAIFEVANATLTPAADELSSIIIRNYYREMLVTEGRYQGSVFHKYENIEQRLTWTYSTAIFYAMTLFTTIGYGTIACQTVIGKTMTIIYAIIGIPLMLVVLSDVGRLLLKWLTSTYNAVLRLFWYLRHAVAKRFHLFRQFANRDSTLEREIKEEDFPVVLALGLTIGYLTLCAVVVEFGDYHDGQTPPLSFGDSFYFAYVRGTIERVAKWNRFTSIATIGLGDVMPNNIEYTAFLALMFLFGLALIGVVNTSVYSKMENKFLNGVDNMEEFFENLYVHRHGKEGYEVMRHLGPSIQLMIVALPIFDSGNEDKIITYLETPQATVHRRPTRNRQPISIGIFGAFRPRRVQRAYSIAACDAEHRPDNKDEYIESPTRPGNGVEKIESIQQQLDTLTDDCLQRLLGDRRIIVGIQSVNGPLLRITANMPHRDHAEVT